MNEKLYNCININVEGEIMATLGSITKTKLAQFDIRQPVFYASMDWDKLVALHKKQKIAFSEIARFPAVQRDLAIVVNKEIAYAQIEKATAGAAIDKLQSVTLFDIFENEKLGADKKSVAVNFTFMDKEKTMTDEEIDAMIGKIILSYEKELKAEIRK